MKLSYKYIVAIIYTIALFLDRLDLTIVNTTLPTIATYFKVSITATDAISIAFLLALAISIPISHWLSQRFGMKNIFIFSLVIFGGGSTLCAWASSLNTLIFLRFMQGIGGGLLIPVGMTMLYSVYDKSEFASITSFTFLPSLSAPAIAPFLGGILLDNFGWRVVYVFSGPICLLLALFSWRYLTKDKVEKNISFDFIGFILSSIILINTFSSLSLIGIGRYYAGSLGLLLLIPMIFLFIRWEKNIKTPLINLSYFKNRLFIKANLLQLCFQICHFGAIFLVVMYLQVGLNMSASRAGLIMGMQAVGAMLTSRYSVKLYNHHGYQLPIVIGLAGVAILSPCIMLIDNNELLFFPLTLFLLRGLFSGLCGTPVQTLSVIDFPKGDIGSINSVFNACRQVSISLGIAISSLLISIGLSVSGLTLPTELTYEKAIQIFHYGFWMITLVAMIGIGISFAKMGSSLDRRQV